MRFLREKPSWHDQTVEHYNSENITMSIFASGSGFLSGEGLVWFDDFDDLVYALQEVQEERLIEGNKP